ncbi:hypothetical protein SDC9_21706 [bioreactor metagenome]|uniref:Uncharacterized protein n=1 Tax=bioreactor metagenome TaxID=1076179 RepID=A0A644UA86_9ZZZZ|nr:hypothetical protein [Candidatus Elulimicrobiales bacterium]
MDAQETNFGMDGHFKLSGILVVENGIPIKKRIFSGKIYKHDKEILEKYSILERKDVGVWSFGLYELNFPTWSRYMLAKIKTIRKSGWSFAKTSHLLSFAKVFKDLEFDKDVLALGERKEKKSSHKTIALLKEEGRKVLRILETEEIKVAKYYFLLVKKVRETAL